jgi:hypothetical protein
MKAAGLYDDRHMFERAGNQFSLVPRNARLGKAGNRAVRNSDRTDDFIGQKSET